MSGLEGGSQGGHATRVHCRGFGAFEWASAEQKNVFLRMYVCEIFALSPFSAHTNKHTQVNTQTACSSSVTNLESNQTLHCKYLDLIQPPTPEFVAKVHNLPCLSILSIAPSFLHRLSLRLFTSHPPVVQNSAVHVWGIELQLASRLQGCTNISGVTQALFFSPFTSFRSLKAK